MRCGKSSATMVTRSSDRVPPRHAWPKNQLACYISGAPGFSSFTCNWTQGGAGTAASIGTFEALVNDDLHELAMQVVVWEFFETEFKMEIAWYFFGAPGVR